MRFSYIISNPPYGNYLNTCFDIKIVNRCNLFCDKQICIFPLTRATNITPFKRKYIDSGHLKFIEALPGNQLFDIKTFSNFLGIYFFDMTKIYPEVEIKCDQEIFRIIPNFENFNDFYRTKILFGDDFVNLINKYKPVYDDLVSRYGTLRWGKRKTWRYFRGHPKQDEDITKYRYQLYISAFSHERDPVYLEPPKLVSGHYFLTDKQNIYENMIYYFRSNFYNLFRRFYFKITRDGCKFEYIPELDFDMEQEKFKKIIDDISDFSKDEIDILKKYKAIYEK